MTKTTSLKLMGMFILMESAGIAAQNMDLSLMVGPLSGTTQSISVTNTTTKVSGGAAIQFAYGYQALRTRAGELWVEIPVTVAARGDITSRPATASVSGTDSTYFTPGVRFKIPLDSHVAFYAAAGGGIGWFGNSDVFSGASISGISSERTTRGVFDCGGGMDFRLTRLLSLRGEVRDFVSARGLGWATGRNHVMYQFGLAFHF